MFDLSKFMGFESEKRGHEGVYEMLNDVQRILED